MEPIKVYIGATQPKFLVASAIPILVGSALGFTMAVGFDWGLFLLALFSIVLIHAGSNMLNDYFDHLSGADWANKIDWPFSGGSRYIQEGLLTPKAMLIEAMILISIGCSLGLVILLLTQSPVILTLGLIGVAGGVFYTAWPLKLCYRGVGEIAIAFLFGILPVTGAYYLQVGSLDTLLIGPALIVGILIFLVILINEFPDVEPDAATDKKTMVVRFGFRPCIIIYRAALASSYIIAILVGLFDRAYIFATGAYLLTLPLGIKVFILCNEKELKTPGQYRVNAMTILLHTLGGLALTLGYVFLAPVLHAN
jgi:1,4-dihydroxy-2-naphthoate octaprenyltransferase